MNIKKIVHNATSWKDLNKTLESFTKSNRSKLGHSKTFLKDIKKDRGYY